MPSTNGHGPKRAILYTRVSGEEQAKKGYSLSDQRQALRDWAENEGYEVLDEITDDGWSGAYLERPGLDRVRDMIEAGGIDVVAVLFRDRIARGIYVQVLKEEFARHGTRLVALNAQTDDSPEGELHGGILDQFAAYERAKIAERTRRGKLRKAREGKIIRGSKAPYGFRYNEAGDGLLVHEPEMLVAERIFRMAAEGLGPHSIQSRLFEEGTPSPSGDLMWPRRTLELVLRSDLYRSHTYEEIAGLVSPEVLAHLDKDAEYGVWWFGRKSTTQFSVSEPDGNGGRRYRKATTTRVRPKEERIAVPVPAYLPGRLVDQARATLAANRPTERKRLARGWELRGLLRCSCGWKMSTHTAKSSTNGAEYHYYLCKQRKQRRQACDCTQRAVRAEEAERVVWEFVSNLLRDPEEIRRGIERLIEQEQSACRGDPEQVTRAWADKIAECTQLRAAYQDQQAAGLMTLEELGAKLARLDAARRLAESEIAALQGLQVRVETLEEDRDTLIESMSEMVPEALDNLTSGEKNRIYQLLRLEVTPTTEGYSVSGGSLSLCNPMKMRSSPNSNSASRSTPWR